jgi:NAD(P)-dependent dehydrogenase (short-subunit alcohol dehydrogenase family)
MKNVIITGASRGIGFELTKLFSAKGFKVIALSRNVSKLNLPNVTAFQLDISSEKSISK